MGRRGIPVDDDARWVFNRLAGAYPARPGYPGELIARVAALAGAGGRVVDLGAGTGHLALPLAAAGLSVTAVEPAREMLRCLAAEARGAVRCVHARAEATTLPGASHDLALVADALHWVDPDDAGREIARVLVAGGVAAIVEAQLAETPFLSALAELLASANFKARRAPAASTGRLVQLLAAARAARAEREVFEHAEVLTPARLDAVLRSLSLVGPALAPAALEELLGRARELAGERPLWARRLTLTWARTPR